eukprot:CAMPEP_0175892842 /NCGR_PEP_ID=MMETSP0107_2-20121207/49136_1 /TAXON_ID=195067 ORGANISM="Goniomonas pacifica, Strain CCMP1869" /NCGR_SAMPLE_ID=MMETSP0107_2 /ASSEMBLY_ACC=CAM_ASM_000203 /LENGTH=74 /DNA_ID=CAMNT_0017213819 /DNA_START=181 /DNA_END=405 /DNA_ORIENTATION=+
MTHSHPVQHHTVTDLPFDVSQTLTSAPSSSATTSVGAISMPKDTCLRSTLSCSTKTDDHSSAEIKWVSFWVNGK